MGIDRRGLLTGGAAAAAVSGGAAAWAQSTSPRVRKRASGLTRNSDDVLAFGDAVRAMKARSDNLSWDRQMRLHREKAQHGNGLFLPWHRLQVSHLERIIGRISGHATFAMPYWDWQGDRFLPDWVTSTTSPLYEAQRAPGANTLDYAKARWSTSRNVARLSSDGFETFVGTRSRAGAVESYGHNHIHNLVGGLMSRTETASWDPVFWLHHCNVDRVWATWHGLAKRSYASDWSRATLSGYIGPDGNETGVWSPGNIIETRSLGYRYDALYPFPVFSVPPQGPTGATRRIPLGSTTWKLRAEGAAGQGKMRLVLPPELVAELRAADDTLMLDAQGEVAFVKDVLLLDRSLEVVLRSGARTARLASSPTFPHGLGGHMHHGMTGMGPETYAIGFQFGEEMLNLIAVSPGEVAIEVEAEDLTPDLHRASASSAHTTLDVTVTRTRWA